MSYGISYLITQNRICYGNRIEICENEIVNPEQTEVSETLLYVYMWLLGQMAISGKFLVGRWK